MTKGDFLIKKQIAKEVREDFAKSISNDFANVSRNIRKNINSDIYDSLGVKKTSQRRSKKTLMEYSLLK